MFRPAPVNFALALDLRLKESLLISVEMHLREQFGSSLAMFSPGHVDPDHQVLPLAAGRHRLEATLRLPLLHRGATGWIWR